MGHPLMSWKGSTTNQHRSRRLPFCHHMVFRFRGAGDDVYFRRRRVEVQLRSQVQHSWATAVEAVGMFRREDLKGGNGDPAGCDCFSLCGRNRAGEGCQVAGEGAVRLREDRRPK